MLIVDMVAIKDSSVRRGTATITSPNGDVTIRIRTRPLPQIVTKFLIKHSESMKHFLLDRRMRIEDVELATDRISMEKTLSLHDFKKELEDVLSTEGGEWKTIIDRYTICSLKPHTRICAFGPRRIGPNILVDSTDLDFRKM
jgi:ribosome assembly protein 1